MHTQVLTTFSHQKVTSGPYCYMYMYVKGNMLFCWWFWRRMLECGLQYGLYMELSSVPSLHIPFEAFALWKKQMLRIKERKISHSKKRWKVCGGEDDLVEDTSKQTWRAFHLHSRHEKWFIGKLVDPGSAVLCLRHVLSVPVLDQQGHSLKPATGSLY